MHRMHLAVRRRQPPKSLTFRRKSFIRQPRVGPRKISPVPKSGTAKTRFLPVLAGFSMNPVVHRSRKASPLTIFRANSIPEKSHLWPESQPVIRAPKNLTSRGSGQENPDFPPEKPHLWGFTGPHERFCCAKWRSFPGNPHTKNPWSPVKPHLSEKLPKRWAESGREEGPANSHLCLHRQKTVQSGTARVLWL